MKSMFVRMFSSPGYQDLEAAEHKIVIKNIERMAEEMFHDLDMNGDGQLTEVTLFKCLVLAIREAFIKKEHFIIDIRHSNNIV